VDTLASLTWTPLGSPLRAVRALIYPSALYDHPTLQAMVLGSAGEIVPGMAGGSSFSGGGIFIEGDGGVFLGSKRSTKEELGAGSPEVACWLIPLDMVATF
jgi:hypothetical protein